MRVLKTELIHAVLDSLPVTALRAGASSSKVWRDKVLQGFRPNAVTVEQVKMKLLAPVLARNPEVESDLVSWWKQEHDDLFRDVTEPELANRWESVVQRWPVTLLAVALELANVPELAEFQRRLSYEQQASAPTHLRPVAAKRVQSPNGVDVNEEIRKLRRQMRQQAQHLRTERAELKRAKAEVERTVTERSHLARKVQELQNELQKALTELRHEQASTHEAFIEAGVAVIPYDQLGRTPVQRLQRLTELTVILATPCGGSQNASEDVLRLAATGLWSRFWTINRKTKRLEVTRQPSEHVLVGTVQLLEDASYVQSLIGTGTGN